MSEQVWRYELNGTRNLYPMPVGAEVLHVGWSRGAIQLWAKVDPGRETREFRTFLVVGTGFDVPADAGQCLGSVVAGDGFHVFHVFEVPA